MNEANENRGFRSVQKNFYQNSKSIGSYSIRSTADKKFISKKRDYSPFVRAKLSSGKYPNNDKSVDNDTSDWDSKRNSGLLSNQEKIEIKRREYQQVKPSIIITN